MIDIHPLAKDELKSAARYWDRQSPGLGDDLIAWWEVGLTKIEDQPLLYPLADDAPVGRQVRQYLIRGLAYRIVYVVASDVLQVIAFAYTKRRPGYWLDRLA
jgi:hypothetical protein